MRKRRAKTRRAPCVLTRSVARAYPPRMHALYRLAHRMVRAGRPFADLGRHAAIRCALQCIETPHGLPDPGRIAEALHAAAADVEVALAAKWRAEDESHVAAAWRGVVAMRRGLLALGAFDDNARETYNAVQRLRQASIGAHVRMTALGAGDMSCADFALFFPHVVREWHAAADALGVPAWSGE